MQTISDIILARFGPVAHREIERACHRPVSELGRVKLYMRGYPKPVNIYRVDEVKVDNSSITIVAYSKTRATEVSATFQFHEVVKITAAGEVIYPAVEDQAFLDAIDEAVKVPSNCDKLLRVAQYLVAWSNQENAIFAPARICPAVAAMALGGVKTLETLKGYEKKPSPFSRKAIKAILLLAKQQKVRVHAARVDVSNYIDLNAFRARARAAAPDMVESDGSCGCNAPMVLSHRQLACTMCGMVQPVNYGAAFNHRTHDLMASSFHAWQFDARSKAIIDMRVDARGEHIRAVMYALATGGDLVAIKRVLRQGSRARAVNDTIIRSVRDYTRCLIRVTELKKPDAKARWCRKAATFRKLYRGAVKHASDTRRAMLALVDAWENAAARYGGAALRRGTCVEDFDVHHTVVYPFLAQLSEDLGLLRADQTTQGEVREFRRTLRERLARENRAKGTVEVIHT